jgi:hypothetical protein
MNFGGFKACWMIALGYSCIGDAEGTPRLGSRLRERSGVVLVYYAEGIFLHGLTLLFARIE